MSEGCQLASNNASCRKIEIYKSGDHMSKSLRHIIICALFFVTSTIPALSQTRYNTLGQPVFGIMEVPEFGPSDIPSDIPHRPKNWRKRNATNYQYQDYYVQQQGKFYNVYPIFKIDVPEKYSKSGKGLAVPIRMRIDSTKIKPNQWGTNDAGLMRSRRITLDKIYPLSRKIHAERNRSSAVKMAKEVFR